MRSGPVLLKIFGAAFGDQVNRQPGSIRCDDRAGFAYRFDAREKAALDLQVFGDGFDDPIHLAAPGDIVFQVSGGDQARGIGREKSGGAGFFRGVEASQHDAIAHGRAFQRQSFALFRGRQARRDDIQQVARNAGVRQMRGDPRSPWCRRPRRLHVRCVVSLGILEAFCPSN